MASFLRQLVAGPRAQHAEAGLDLCYVTSNIIATSGPSQTYPKRAYRNPLDRLVGFLDEKHGADWAIWEFRAEGTGYPDEAVYHRVRHYPWPDHHPPPFGLVPMIVASMRNWLDGEDLHGPNTGEQRPAVNDGNSGAPAVSGPSASDASTSVTTSGTTAAEAETAAATSAAAPQSRRVVVVHCKAGKGRSGTSAVSYLIAEEGWTVADALARFTERRMRPRFGAGVSIPSQIRTISYVDRWANAWKRAHPEQAATADAQMLRKHRHYIDRAVEVVEVHAWGLRNGVKLEIGGYADEGKKIEVRHVFSKHDRIVVVADPPGGGGIADMVYDMAGYGAEEEAEDNDRDDGSSAQPGPDHERGTPSVNPAKTDADDETEKLLAKLKLGHHLKRKTGLIQHPAKSKTNPNLGSSSTTAASHTDPAHPSSTSSAPALAGRADTTPATSDTSTNAASSTAASSTTSDAVEPGGRAVIFKPATPIIVPHSDVLVRLERRHRAPKAVGLAMVTATAHVWFNVFFEGNGPELMAEGAEPQQSGVFDIMWEQLDGLKGSSRKGARAVERLAVVWRVVGEGKLETEPGKGEAVPQMRPADWRRGEEADGDEGKDVGDEAQVGDDEDKKSVQEVGLGVRRMSDSEGDTGAVGREIRVGGDDSDEELAGVKSSGPEGT